MNMIDLPFNKLITMDRKEFVDLAYEVITKHGQPLGIGGGLSFEDNWVRMISNRGNIDLEVTRLPQDVDRDHLHSHLSEMNVITVVTRGQITRHHREHCYLVWHFQQLLHDRVYA